MSALPPQQMAAMRDAAVQPLDQAAALRARWEAVHALALQVAELAAIAPERDGNMREGFPLLVVQANGWQRDIAQRGLEDMDAMLRLGLSALTTVTKRGQDASVPALALWREFHHARGAVLAAMTPQAEAA